MSAEIKPGRNLYKFDAITVDSENVQIRKNGECLTLTPRAFDVLVFLLTNRGRMVDKKELFDGVWKNTFVTDNALTKVIKEIRHVLGDSATEPRYIETVPKHGYRFIAPVGEVSRQASPAHTESGFGLSTRKMAVAVAAAIAVTTFFAWYLLRPTTRVSTDSSVRSIAVLPFKPLNIESRDESFELGMAEAVITRLTNLKQLAVRPLSSVRKYTDVNQDPTQAGRDLQAESVLDGSVQRVGDRIRVTVRLIDVKSGNAFWSEKFDEDITDVFKVQDSIAERIAAAFAIELNGSEKELITKRYTNDPKAYELYLQAQVLFHGRRPNWIQQSLDHYRKAIDRDPDFALAYVGIMRCYFSFATNRIMTGSEVRENARSAIVKALEIDDSLAEAHNALAELKYQAEFDWPGAEIEFQKAIALNPNVAWIRLAYGWFLMSQGRFDESRPHMEMSRTLDPSSLGFSLVRGKYFYYTRRYDEALELFQNVHAQAPNDIGANLFLFFVYDQKQMYPEAAESLLEFMSLSGHLQPEAVEDLRRVFRISGREAFFSKLLENLQAQSRTKHVEAYRFAIVYTRLGRKDEAFAWLEKMFDERDPLWIQFKVDPANDWLHDDPRYAQLVRRMGLEP